MGMKGFQACAAIGLAPEAVASAWEAMDLGLAHTAA